MPLFKNSKWVLIVSDECKWAQRAQKLMDDRGLTYELFNINAEPEVMRLTKAMGFTIVPQIFRDGILIGGCTSLEIHLNITENDHEDF